MILYGIIILVCMALIALFNALFAVPMFGFSVLYAALATVILFTAIQHWNAWFDGTIYMQPDKMPLQSYIYTMINEATSLRQSLTNDPNQAELLATIPPKTLESAQIFIAILPIIPIYPFAQKFFIKGLVLGSVKE